jgi:hypothetical protein
MYSSKHGIHEITTIIPIFKKISTETSSPKNEYSLKQSFFDPTKSSPPNEFMIKLYMRNNLYNLSHKNEDKREMQ